MISYEHEFRARMNVNALKLLAAHVPAVAVLAAIEGSGVLFALLAGLLLLVGPAALYFTAKHGLSTSISMGISSMGYSALIIHLGHGMIEMHFHIFAVLALLTIFGSIWPILAAAGIIAVHHIAFWLWLPSSVFNYKATFGVVLLHAFFVVFETVPACYLALQFGRAIRNQAITREQLEGTSERVREAAAALAAQSEELATRTQKQAATLEETSAASTEVAAAAHQMVTHTQQAVTVIDNADACMARANATLEQLAASLKEMASSSQEIEKIIRMIDGIAFQTNILALNAAVEAARAGSAGEGFAVVADEVRRLAQRSATAAHDTAQLIAQAARTSRASQECMAEISSAMVDVTSSTVSIRELIGGVNASGQEQMIGITHVSEAIAGLARLTQLTAATAEENASVGATLRQQAQGLAGIVAALKNG